MGSGKYTEEDPERIDLKTICDKAYNEDLSTRQIQVRYWKRLKYYWNNFSQVFWSEAENSYKIWGRDDVGNGTEDQSYYDKPVNVFKAFLETIIAALSVNIPAISCVPDDADNPNDISTAKAGNKISELIYKHNNAIFLWLQALYVYCTEGLIACYIYTDEDKKYGTYQEKQFKDEEVEGYFCPSCKRELDEDMVVQAKVIAEQLKSEYDPSSEDSELNDYEDDSKSLESGNQTLQPIVCPECAVAIDGNLAKSTLTIPRFIGYTTKVKSRICLEVYGGLYVKVANYARKQADTPYLGWFWETAYVNVLEAYPDLWEKIDKSNFNSNQGNDPIEQYARLNIQYRGTVPDDNVSVKTFWLRPASFNWLETKEKADALKKKYPDGVKVVIVQDIIAEVCAEDLDDHWQLTQNPTSDYLNHEPLGEVLVNIQDIINDLISMTLQLIEHGIPENWVDPAVVSVDMINQREVIPGAYTPTKTVSASKNISEAFYETKAATVSPEIFQFYKIINELGQFVSGALPAIFGGPQAGAGGETASAYAQAKGMALQRLQTPWKMLTVWWKGIFGKAIPAYMKLVVEDERYVKKDEQGNFVNTFIRKAELVGKIGDVELEAADQLPISDEQQKDIILQLMQLNNMEVFEALTAPENLPYIRKIVRIPQFRLPGEDDRQKQYEEINELVNSVPIPDGAGGFTSSVEVDVILDNHKIEAEICRSWLVGDAGRLAKIENPQGYMNVLLHYQAHITEVNKQAAIVNATNAAAATTGSSDKTKTTSGLNNKGTPEKPKGKSNVSV